VFLGVGDFGHFHFYFFTLVAISAKILFITFFLFGFRRPLAIRMESWVLGGG